MGVLRCTAKYRKTMALPSVLPEPGPARNALGDWYGNTLNVGPRRYLHYLSENGRLSVIVNLRERHDAEQRFLRQLAQLLRDLGSSEALVDREMAATSALTYGSSRNRSVLGSMRDHAFFAAGDLTDGRYSLYDVMLRLAHMPAGPLDMSSADQVVPTLLQRYWSGPRSVA